jgi:hypothetical protein
MYYILKIIDYLYFKLATIKNVTNTTKALVTCNHNFKKC